MLPNIQKKLDLDDFIEKELKKQGKMAFAPPNDENDELPATSAPKQPTLKMS